MDVEASAYGSAQVKGTKKLVKHAPTGGKQQAAKKFLKKDHSDSNMLVAIRIRPLAEKEKANKEFEIVRAEDKLLIVMDRVDIEYENEGKKPDVLHRSKEQRYYFDRIFNEYQSTQAVYERTCQHLIASVVKGFNGTVFAYGTTGSGKTFTMTGNEQSPGIMYKIVEDMFNRIKSDEENTYDIRVSYVEIYNEVIRDLLVPNSKNTYLELRDDPIKGVQLAGVTEFQVKVPQEVMDLLVSGNKRRTTESTKANETSSRSHAICQIQLAVKDKLKNIEEEFLCGKLSLVDLAGSERGTVTENRGIRLMEGAKINTSLLALANCINALGDKNKKGSFVPFRDSKLTRMLKDSLGGNCKTVMIATVSPASSQQEETINTLKYANRAKNIKMRVEANKKLVTLHISAYKNIISDLREEIDVLKSRLAKDITDRGFAPTKTQQASEFKRVYQEEAERIMREEDAKLKPNKDCVCDSRSVDNIEKKVIMQEIQIAYEKIIQLEQALIELDEQNTLNAMEIRKREAKVFLTTKQIEDIEETIEEMNKNGETEGEYGSIETLQKEIESMTENKNKQTEQILILNESTKQNLVKRQTMKDNLYENYQDIRNIKDSIEQRIQNEDIRDFLELVIKNNFLESQNVQLLLNLQLQARTMIDLKNMITKQQKFIDDNDIVGKHDGNIDLFSDDENEKDMGVDIPDQTNEEGLTDNNAQEDEQQTLHTASIVDIETVTRSAGAVNGRKLGASQPQTSGKVSQFANNNSAAPTMGGLVVSGIPMSQRQGAPIPNLNSINAQYRKGNQPPTDENVERISRTKTAKENKAIKEKLDAEYKQSIEGLSIVGTSANNKKQ